MRRAVFILGMHRSGTSVLAGLLRLAGMELGSDLLLGDAAENRRGFWEHREVVRINDELLSRLGLSWHVPSPLPEGYASLPQTDALADRASRLVRREFAGTPLWGIKDPRLCRLQVFWERACAGVAEELRAVHVFRHPLEVADSLLSRNGMPAEQALLLWLFHNLEAVLHPRQLPLVTVSLRRLIEAPLTEVSRVVAALSETDRLSPDAGLAIRRFVDPALVHHRFSSADDRLLTPVGRLALRCHDRLERLADGEEGHAEFADLWRQLLAHIDARRAAVGNGPRDVIDVIVPVYAGLASTERCIDSVLRGGGRHHLIVINDASPDPLITERLRQWAAGGAFQLIENSRNTGFVATVNRGIAIHPDRDVVLLNADTMVPPGWLDRLQRAAYSNDWIGTVTPFSNNATLCSYPLPQTANELPAGHDVASLDQMFQAANPGLCLDIPTAVGCCMYVRRDCLAAVGPFDEKHFGRGYGEETDFSMRAAKLGWRNVAAADVFVYHEGCVSFGKEADGLRARAAARMQELHPEYGPAVERFLAEDLLALAREDVDAARIARCGPHELRAVMGERAALHAMRRRTVATEREALLRDTRRLDGALAHAQRLVEARHLEVSQLTAALQKAERIADERASLADDLDRRLRAFSDAKDEAERIATQRLEELASRDRQLRDTAAALAAAEKLATDHLEQARQLETAKEKAERIATQRLEELASRDRQLRDTAAALAAAETIAADHLELVRRLEAAKEKAERIATERSGLAAELDRQNRALSLAKDDAERIAAQRLTELALRDRQLRDTAAALAAAEKIAAARLAAVADLDARLRATGHALEIAESLAIERLATIEDLSRQLTVYTAGAIEQVTGDDP
jgi:GT2 family glycosyltransferase